MIRRNPFVPLVLIIVLFLAACAPTEGTSQENSSEPSIPTITPNPIVSEPTPETTIIEPVPEAAVDNSIQGSVELARGACCAGGPAGDTIQVPASFTAESPHGEIESMRVKTHRASCVVAGDMADSEWEPFTEVSGYEAVASSGWSSLFVSVQFQDAAGNISAVFCDDVAVEGMAPLPQQ